MLTTRCPCLRYTAVIPQDPAEPNFITTRVAFAGPPIPGGSGGPAYSDARPLRNLLRHAALSQVADGRILATFPTDRGQSGG